MGWQCLKYLLLLQQLLERAPCMSAWKQENEQGLLLWASPCSFYVYTCVFIYLASLIWLAFCCTVEAAQYVCLNVIPCFDPIGGNSPCAPVRGNCKSHLLHWWHGIAIHRVTQNSSGSTGQSGIVLKNYCVEELPLSWVDHLPLRWTAYKSVLMMNSSQQGMNI